MTDPELKAPEALSKEESVNISRIQLILAEKRTSLAVLRTGIAVFTLPLSVITVLIATSKYYEFLQIYHLIIPLLILCAGLLVLAIYLVHRSILHIWRQESMMDKIKHSDPNLSLLYYKRKL
ncbi:MAG: hypothetical protein JXR73_08830 [Candidatus Omnitrophica bacterium]|nr:hypothetical protein [Candidatus Omnitrophota bacterium]